MKYDYGYRTFQRATLACFGAAVCAWLWSGCGTAHHRRSADKEVYSIIRMVEGNIFGHTNEFTINTPYSDRDPGSILPMEIIEDRLATNQHLLKLGDALDLAAAQSRRYQTEKERLYLTALTLTGERYEFSPQFFARSTAEFARSTAEFARSTAEFNRFSNGEKQGTLGSRIGVSQLLQTGGRLTLNLANDLLRYYTGDPRKAVISAVSVNLFQPLMRGFGKNNPAVERLTQAEREVVYAVRSFSFFQNEFSIEIVNDYFNLLAQKNIIRNNYSNYLSQVQSTKRLEARAKDRESISQVDLARQSELAAKNNYVNAVALYLNSLYQFQIKLGIPLNEKVFLDDSELEELKTIGLIPVNIDANEAFRLAVNRQYEILNSIDRFEDAKRKIRVAANQLKADLNLFADASLASEPPTDYTEFDFDKVNYGVGIELDLPINRLRERNNYRATLVSFESELRTLALALDALKDSIDRGVRTLEQRRQNYEIQRNALDLANRRVQSNELLLQAGRAEVRDLVEAQNDQIQAQNSVTAALVSYQETRLQLLLNLGVIETELDIFWFKSHLESVPEIGVSEAAPLFLPRGELIQPDQIFNN